MVQIDNNTCELNIFFRWRVKMIGNKAARDKLIASYGKKGKKTPNQKKGGGMTREESNKTSYESTQRNYTSSQTGQTAVKRSMLFNNQIESGNYREDKTLSGYDKALMKNLRKAGIRPTSGANASSGGNFVESQGIGSSRARQALTRLLYPKGLK